jgi:serine/threonine-protein kinase
VIHRDLKPDNIFVCSGTSGDEVRILDFGSVKLQMETGPKLTMLGTTLGSPYYMSPEQAMGRADIDPRTDVFALAAIMHEMATGEIAFDGDEIADILQKILAHDPPPASIANADYPWAFDDVVRKGLHKDKEHRYSSAIELAEAMLRAFGLDPDVERWARASSGEIERSIREASEATAEVVPSPLPGPESRFPSELPIRDNRGAKLLAGLVLLAALFLSIWLVLS